METQNIWDNFNEELYFFILKNVKDKNIANDIFQNTFLKIHNNLGTLKEQEKVKSWVFQIARNETINHFNKEKLYTSEIETLEEIPAQNYQHICCFDKFINNLPEIQKQVIELIYIKGLMQKDVAKHLDVSLENVKIRVKRAKDTLKKNFNECCKYEINKEGKLFGESNCSTCKT
jgi:RNA polymerase sigma-70 factor, ECF subfamily